MSFWPIALRTSATILAVFGAFWSVYAFESQPDLGQARALADKIAGGLTFDADFIRVQADRTEALSRVGCDPSFLTSALVIQAHAAEVAVAYANLAEVSRRFDSTTRVATTLIACVPTSSFGWLSIYWTALNRVGFSRKLLPLLAESYRTGGREVWLQVRRSALAMTIYGELDEPLKAEALDEYLGLISFVQREVSVNIFMRLDDKTRAVVMSHLGEVSDRRRTLFVRALSRNGVDVDLPRSLGRPDRPWLH